MKHYIKLAFSVILFFNVFVFLSSAADIGVGIQFSAENFNAEKMDFYPGFNVVFMGGTGYVGGMLSFDLVSEGVSSSIYGMEEGDRARLASLFLVGQYPLGNLTLYLGPGVGAYLDSASTMQTTIQDNKMLFVKSGVAYRFTSVSIFLESIFYTYVAPAFKFDVSNPKIVFGASYMF